MKNRYYILGCLAALMGLMTNLYSCTDELEGIGGTSTRPTDVVCFTASLSDGRTSSVSRGASGQLEIEQEEWLVGKEKKQDASRGAPVSLLSGSAGVIGIGFSNNDTESVWSSNAEYKFDGDELTAKTGDVRWSTIAGNSRVSCHVYAPYNNSNISGKTINYQVPTTVTQQQDLIVASWTGAYGTNYGTKTEGGETVTIQPRTIPLTFEHALTAVKFKVGFACTVTKLEVKGIYNSGTYTFGSGWSVNETSTDANVELTSDYEFTFGEDKSFAANAALTDGESTLMMIPQELPNGAEVVLTTTDNGTITIPLKGKVWQEGKMITYTIHKEQAPSYIYFDLAAGNVNITKDNFTGKVYTSSSATTATEVKGTHTSGNRYYVYQSTPTKRVEGKGITTISTVNGKKIYTHAPLDYPLVTLEDGRLWSDYITNNTNVQQVIGDWDNAAGAGQATQNKVDNVKPNNEGAAGAVRKVGREATKNRIHITGNVGSVNLFIDNIYSSYQERASAWDDGAVRSRTKGGISFLPSENGGNSTLTINIIGDNRLGCVNYQNNDSTRNCLVFEGTGSLTVADTDYYWNDDRLGSNRSCSVIGGKDEPKEQQDVYNITINSGVIYAGGTTSTCTAIGGGGNGNTTITINGGTITAVTNSTGAAIGGGTGLKQPGGIGNVTINGGNIYAYNFRVKNAEVPAAAIGGGGSSIEQANAGIVTITGGYVYAYSGCGTAIGGGSSSEKQGGNAVVNILGGQVIAKSNNGTGIGGGTGSSTKYNANGGNAEVTIDGNPIIRTGSIGGGGKGPQSKGTIGAAIIEIKENCTADIQAQFVMAAGTASDSENSFTMKGGTIRNSYVDDEEYIHIKTQGGAVYLEDGTFTMTGGTIKNCSAEQGGAVYIERKSTKPMGEEEFNFKMTGGEIHSCFATGNTNGTILGHGGAVCLNGGQVLMTDGTIRGNYSENGDGGAIYINNGNFIMRDDDLTDSSIPTISDNSAQKGNGGGVFVSSASSETSVQVNLLHGLITGNAASNYGGGVCVDMGVDTDHEASVVVGEERQGDEQNTNPNISGNTSLMSGGGLYVRGAKANITINGGNITENSVSAYVKNENVANEGGMVALNADNVTDIVTITYHDINTTYNQKVVKNTNTNMIKCPDAIDGKNFVRWNNREDGNGTINYYTNGGIINISNDLELYAIRKDQ